MGEHLDDNAASEFVSGALSPGALTRIEGHLASCRDCRALVAALAQDAGDDSGAPTFRYELLSPSQLIELPRRALSVGDRVSRYLVLSSIGAGGMGVVFAAYDPQLDRKIALKLLRDGLAVPNKDARARLRREAQAIAQLSHPNVVSVYDVGTTDDDELYIAMEFVEGDTLTSWLRAYPRTWREIIDVFRQAARGLAAAHSVGLLHRDFKPDNVLVGGDGRVRVTDFGLARSVLAPDELGKARPEMTALDAALTATGTVLGTPRYMPPEQLTGQMTGHDLDARSDQFSFCVALYEALYGGHPLAAGTSLAMLERQDRAKPPPEGTKVPPAIGRAVLRGLERDRARRWPSMAALIEQLGAVPHRPSARYLGFAVTAVLVLGGTTAAMLAKQPRPLPPPPDQTVIQKLIDEKHGLEREIGRLRTELAQRVDLDRHRITEIEESLRAKEAVIQELTITVNELQTFKTRAVRAVDAGKQPARPSPAMLSDALAARRAPVLGCFEEWAQRNPVAQATLVVGLMVDSDGRATTPRILSTPDSHPVTDDGVQGRSELEFCVSEQVAAAQFPAGFETVEIEVAARWAPGTIQMLPAITGAHPADAAVQ
ncbi:MAG TPA: protein kinase [Kofleriaceae bacterium]|nr:protein kinase [Kofleriaceae bacterium]